MNILQSIYNEPHMWELVTIGVYSTHFKHKRDGVEVRTTEGIFSYNLVDGGKWSLVMKWKFRKAFMWCANKQIEQEKEEG